MTGPLRTGPLEDEAEDRREQPLGGAYERSLWEEPRGLSDGVIQLCDRWTNMSSFTVPLQLFRSKAVNPELEFSGVVLGSSPTPTAAASSSITPSPLLLF